MLLTSTLLFLTTSAFAVDGTAFSDLNTVAPHQEAVKADALSETHRAVMEQIDAIDKHLMMAKADPENARAHIERALDGADVLGAELEWLASSHLDYLEQQKMHDTVKPLAEVALKAMDLQEALVRELEAIVFVMWNPDSGKTTGVLWNPDSGKTTGVMWNPDSGKAVGVLWNPDAGGAQTALQNLRDQSETWGLLEPGIHR
ncbi:MAG: hypothetical protein AAFV53_20270 [Myxococcota bacterium]